MNSTKKIARVAGVLYLLMAITGAFSVMYIPHVLIVQGSAAETADKILSSERLFRVGIVSELVAAVLFVFMVVVLYRLFSSVNRPNTYDDNGRLTKTISGNATEPGTETLYGYDEEGRLLSITKSGKEAGSKSEFHYDEQGRKTAVQYFDPETLKRAQKCAYAGSPWDFAVEVGGVGPCGRQHYYNL